MQVSMEIGFDQLVGIVKKLPPKQWTKLKTEVEKDKISAKDIQDDMEAFLLKAPVFTKKQLDTIAKTRKAINQWRTKQ
jgi:hypothetical protein